MKAKQLPEPLAHILSVYCDVNALSVEGLRQQILEAKVPTRAEAFRTQLAEAIVHRTLTPKDYEALTGEDFDTPEDLNVWLRKLWSQIFGRQPIPGDYGSSLIR